MNLTLRRFVYGPNYTIGRLFLDQEGSPGVYSLADLSIYTLEDKMREVPCHPVAEWKVAGETAIPRGRYPVVPCWFPRYKRDMPLLLNVPGFTGIFLHTGNTDADTSGCILIGKTWTGGDFIGYSWTAFDQLWPLLVAAWHASGGPETITLEVE